MARRKRVATNSMIATAKRCRKKFVWRYVWELVPARSSRSPTFGSLFHSLVRVLAVEGLEADLEPARETWRRELLADARQHSEQVQAMLGFQDDSLVETVEQKCSEIGKDAMELVEYYRKTVLYPERDRYRVLWAEQPFSVPLTTRNGRVHPTWRLEGKWDLVLEDIAVGRVVIRDFKTTVRMPGDFAMLAELDTQPIAYLYAGLYLATKPRPSVSLNEIIGRGDGWQMAGDPDFPFWPSNIARPAGFELEVIRKKVPKEPPLLKSGRLSKAQNIDTTPELFEGAIMRHSLDRNDYLDVIDRLQRRGPAFHYRSQVGVGREEIEKWAEETRQCLEDIRALELHPERAYRADPMTCQNQYGRRCEYHALCFGDEEFAMADFVKREKHSELTEED